jgi:thiol-disulfide isomerase/thioredoxin
MTPMKELLLPLLLCSFSAVAADSATSSLLHQPLAEARARHAAVFVDFAAVWCHSCYFMDKEVLTGAQWDAVKKRAVIVQADADSPEGGDAVKQFNVAGFPTYLVLDEQGKEVGRILGDRPRQDFYALLEPILARGAALEHWQSLVKDGGAGSVAAGRVVLDAFYQRMGGKSAADWLASLPEPARASLTKDAKAADLLARLRLFGAAEREDSAECKAAATAALETIDCDHLMELSRFQGCLAKEPVEAQRAALAPFKPRMAQLQEDVLVKRRKGICSDTRGVVETAVDLYDGLDDKAAREQVLSQGVAYSEGKLKGRVASDRGLADNLRFYRELQKDDAALDALYPKLIAAWPDDYVYAYRWGKSLAKRGKFQEALPLLEQAAPKSFGRNRLWVAQWRAYVLLKLQRAAEARAQAGEALQANGPWFEKDAAELKAVVEGKTPA